MWRDRPTRVDHLGFAALVVISAVVAVIITDGLVALCRVMFGYVDQATVHLLWYSIAIGCFVWMEGKIFLLVPRWSRCRLPNSYVGDSLEKGQEWLFSPSGDLHYVVLPREAWDARDAVLRRYPEAQFEVELFGGDPILSVQFPGDRRSYAITIWDRDMETGEVTAVYSPH
ncbi:PepSY domain-containing protein [Candidatus Kaiserbacteria bacterium]|nr:PepSY domain-containing protein [Candidatus Kaiserbacteria bacterium]